MLFFTHNTEKDPLIILSNEKDPLITFSNEIIKNFKKHVIVKVIFI